jgi:hypothetical protein
LLCFIPLLRCPLSWASIFQYGYDLPSNTNNTKFIVSIILCFRMNVKIAARYYSCFCGRVNSLFAD